MKVGDRVEMSPMWKYDNAIGTVTKLTRDGYTVIIWDGVNGEWHYTEEQSKRLKLLQK